MIKYHIGKHIAYTDVVFCFRGVVFVKVDKMLSLLYFIRPSNVHVAMMFFSSVNKAWRTGGRQITVVGGLCLFAAADEKTARKRRLKRFRAEKGYRWSV